ncbi:glycine cleavage system aminomethyltransferase GcvT [Erythrobacter litoralis]|uniref:aminomethyltransferase n=1 Tax=Erythrobacter litoralis (strain HTCC2594) TaxID=314225 RepID=Q2N884_ERYLH|nr:glycine cleavage system aminomethyltransferase GcvT [Erythrobacter litoralis]ABC64107.1 glycine cleavage system T protein [Erythrobacter litoralis HTCC2594]
MSDTDTQDLAKLPLDAWHRAQGARMVPFAGYEMPIQYTGPSGGIVAEHNWTRESASLFDVSHMGQLVISGEGATEALEALVPGKLSSLKPGNIRYTLLLNEDGGILDDLMVTNMSREDVEEFYLVVNGATKWDDIAHLREHLPDEITMNHLDGRGLVALQGPKAAEALETVFPGVAERLVFMQGTGFEWRGDMIGVARCGYTGEDGFEINISASHIEQLAEALVADDRVRPAGLGARDSLRLEAGLPLYGHDLTVETDPVSADLTFALTKSRRETGGWMGHGRIAQALMSGPETKRVGLKIEGRMPAREGALVYIGDAEIGRVTSGGFSPTLGYPIAMAYIAREQAIEGTEVEIEVRNKRLPATVVPMPFVPHRYYRGK